MQLPLPVSLPTDETFESFVCGKNQQLVALLDAISVETPHWQRCSLAATLATQPLPLVNIVSGTGQGKSHLLYAVAHRLSDRQIPHIYLNLHQHSVLDERVLEGLEDLSVIALDNIHAICGEAGWEEALFHLINRITENQNTILLCTAKQSPSATDFTLPDLQSRLQWGTTFSVKLLTDEERHEALKLRALQKGLQFSNAALRFLLHHYDRNLKSLMLLLERLDTRSLQEQRKITVSLIKRELNLS